MTLRVVWRILLVPIFLKIKIPLENNGGLPQHRIWWYPTGPLTFIPIHAAGPENGNVSRIIISSYVTSLNSLLHAQETQQGREDWWLLANRTHPDRVPSRIAPKRCCE
jgi:hypothetical protein